MAVSDSGPKMDLLVIGYGNTLRSDDGVGPRVVEAVETLHLPGVRTISCGLLTPELAEPVSQASRVIFVDASVAAGVDVQLRPLLSAAVSQLMAHAADPCILLALARDVFGHVPEALWLTIRAQNLAIGEELSVKTREGLARAVEEIRRLARSGPAAAE